MDVAFSAPRCFASPRRAMAKGVLLRGLGVVLVSALLLTFATAPSAAAGPGSLWQSYLSGEGIPSGAILSVMVASDGGIWFGTDVGAARYDGAWETISADDGRPLGRIRAIVQSADGAIWFGTDTGVARRAPDGRCCQIWRKSHGLPDDDVHALAVGAHSPADPAKAGVWVGTTQGLAFVDGERAVRDAQAPVADVQALTVAANGDLLASLAGQGVWRRDAGGAWQAITGGESVAEGPLALSAGADGRIWAGVADGLIVFQEDRWRRFLLFGDRAAGYAS